MLLLDEPMAGMGPDESARMVTLLRELKRELTILLIEHDMEAVFALADRITVLVYGRIIATGTPARTIRANAEVRQAYLGEQEAVGEGGAAWLRPRCSKSPAIETCYGLSKVLFGMSLVDRARRDGDAHGPQRHGQDHDRALDHGAHPGDGRHHPVRRRATSARCRPTRSPSSASGWCRRAARCFPT